MINDWGGPDTHGGGGFKMTLVLPDVSYPQPSELLSKADRGKRLQNALQVLPILERFAEFCGIV